MSIHRWFLIIAFGIQSFKMAKVEDCTLTNVDILPFDFEGGGCNTFSFGVMLCVSYYGRQMECHS